MNRRTYAIPRLLALISALALEILPYGAVLHFAALEGGSTRATFSYFDPITFGYTNFGPLITAVLTCLLTLLAAVSLFARRKAIGSAVRTLSLIAFVISLSPLLVSCYSVIGGIISALLLLSYILSLKQEALS